MQLSFIALMIQRIKSENPEFYKKLQRIALILLAIDGGLWFFLWLGIGHLDAALHDKLNTACYALGTFLIGVFFTTTTGTKNPDLVSNDTKEAIVKEANKDNNSNPNLK